MHPIILAILNTYPTAEVGTSEGRNGEEISYIKETGPTMPEGSHLIQSHWSYHRDEEGYFQGYFDDGRDWVSGFDSESGEEHWSIEAILAEIKLVGGK